MVGTSSRAFSYDHNEIKRMELEVKKKLQVLRMFSEMKDFDYEPPTMTYDKKTGEVKIQEKKDTTKKRVIKSVDDLEREKKALFAEVGLD